MILLSVTVTIGFSPKKRHLRTFRQEQIQTTTRYESAIVGTQFGESNSLGAL